MPDRIVSHPATQEYRDNYDRVFGKKSHVATDMHVYVDGVEIAIYTQQPKSKAGAGQKSRTA